MRRARPKRLKRFHRQIFFPKWTEESLRAFLIEVRTHGSLTLSIHAVEKSWEYGTEYGRKFLKFMLGMIRGEALRRGELFEFYAYDQEIRKACFRVASEDLPVDLVVVISADGVVVTVWTINKKDNHDTLDEELYERSA